jgi:hypothetical protein
LASHKTQKNSLSIQSIFVSQELSSSNDSLEGNLLNPVQTTNNPSGQQQQQQKTKPSFQNRKRNRNNIKNKFSFKIKKKKRKFVLVTLRHA